jgi:hypothetical protein
VPEIEQAIELVPVGRVKTEPIRLFDDDRYVLNLEEHDLFAHFINLRTVIKKQQRQAQSRGDHDDAAFYKSMQEGLKELANATSYGIQVQLDVLPQTKRKKPVTVYGMQTDEISTHQIERAGAYFAGPIGALITAAGRLMVAMGEKLALDQGIYHAVCDTDSLAPARPDGMSREEFQARVSMVTDWFNPLSPYEGRPPILEHEDENSWQGKSEPLFFLGISSKRYALYNRLPDGIFRIRKFSSHGTGMWRSLPNYKSPPDIPEPCDDVFKLGNGPR